MTDRVRELETLTMGEFFRKSLDSTDAVELVGAVTGLEVWWEKAITFLIRDEIGVHGSGGRLDEIVGGTDRLTDELYRLIKDRVDVRLYTDVKSIDVRSGSVQLVTGKRHSDELVRSDEDFVICTIPFPVLRRLELSGLSSEKMSAIRNLTYASSAKVLLFCESRFWESGGVVGGGSQFDAINRQVYYPSDAHTPCESEHVGTTHGIHGGDRRYSAKNAGASEGHGVLVGSYCWGADARRIGSIPRSQRVDVVASCIGDVHPEILEPGMVLDGVSMYWDEHQWSGGAFSFLRPGDIGFYFDAAKQAEGRLFFAGEHCSLDQAWLQGAISSGLEAVRQVVSST